jgi:proteasome lid subunit RPN8/RPN11
MDFRISRAAHAQILAEATASPAREVCGLLLGDGEEIKTALPCPNVAADPACTFEIDPQTLIAAHKSARTGGPNILGCYHSHPNGRAEPSETDRAMAEDNGWVWAIVAGGDVTFWRVEGDGFVGVSVEIAN